MISATVHSKIVLPLAQLTTAQRVVLEKALTIENPDKDRAVREYVKDAHDLPDEIELFYENGHSYMIPRGFAAELPGTLGEEIEWKDERVSVPIDTSGWRPVTLRDYQEKAVCDLIAHEQGVYKAPTASGKTVAGLELIRRLSQRSIVIVNNVHIANQWRERASDHLGLKDVGLIGDKSWDEADLTIAIQQSLWSRADDLDEWWETWGLVQLDECHHAPANTFFDVIQRFPARYRVGLSATPNKQKGFERLVLASLGPIVANTERKVLVEAGMIVEPTVEILTSSFSHNFWPTHTFDRETEDVCRYRGRGCNRGGPVHRNNYTEVIAALIDDDERNDLLAARTLRAYHEDRAVLVLSRRHKHLDNMARRVIAQCGAEDVYRLSGKEKTAEKKALYKRAEDGRLVIYSTVGDEALDIPRLDTVVLSFPGKNEGLIEQQIGRVARVHGEKAIPEVIDISDNMKVLDSQLKARMRVYRRQDLAITVPSVLEYGA